MCEFNLTDLSNYKSTANSESRAEAIKHMKACHFVLKEIIRQKKPYEDAPLREPRKAFKPSEPRVVTDDDTFMGIFIKRKGTVAVVIGIGFNLPCPKLHWVNVQNLGIPTQQSLAKWSTDTFYSASQIFKTIGINFCALVLQARRGYTGIDSEILRQCAFIPEVKFLQVSMTASVERILADVLHSERFSNGLNTVSISDRLYRHGDIMAPAFVVFDTSAIESHQLVLCYTKPERPSDKKLMAVGKFMTEGFTNLGFRLSLPRKIEFSNLTSETQGALEKTFVARTDISREFTIYCGCKTSFCAVPVDL
mmetsp:Transcript_29836/g.53061  ORF Transcript_29836/g.53061 Transcript_29836/m.53061 type:complete len:308 (+) Transcript_29836:82-1005(+)